MRRTEFFVAATLSILLTVALSYATLGIPTVTHQFLLGIFPNYWWPSRDRRSLEALRLISFIVTLGLIVVGFLAQRLKLSTLGSIILYLPTFGYFAFTMFFLAGIGVLRLLWLPLLDFSPRILRLGDIIYLPYFALGLLLPVTRFFSVPVMAFSTPLSIMIWRRGS